MAREPGDMADHKQTLPMPGELAGLFNLMAHPAAGVAAVSALGLGLASHGFGMWLGALTGAAEQMEKLIAASETGARPTASTRAKADTKKLIAKVKLVAREVAEASSEAAALERPKAPKIEAEPKPAVEAPAVLLPEDFHAPHAIEKPKKADDLKKIAGIGPKLETVLNGLGVWTYSQVAAWTPAEIAWMDDYLGFKGRIARDRWIEQAAALAGGGRRK
jgi:NADH-quinone oxidoreductase subunit E